MKRQAIIAVMLFILAAVLAACSPAKEETGSARPSAVQSETPSASAAQPTETLQSASGETTPETSPQLSAAAQTGGIDTGDMVFPEQYDEYFGGDTNAAVEKMSPMLLAAAQAAYAVDDMMFGEIGPVSKWAVIYQYLNAYGDADYERQEDGTLVVGEKDMLSLFRDFFGADAVLPELQTSYDISYDAAGAQYLVGRSDFGDVSFAMTDLALSNQAAFITLTADSAAQFDVVIQITPSADSRLGYNLLQITQLCGST